jgi:hypothetical protein
MADKVTYQGTISRYEMYAGRVAGVLQDSQRPDHLFDGIAVITSPATIHEGVAITESGSVYLLVEPRSV